MIQEGLMIMLSGMIIVFVFLMVIILSIHASFLIINKLSFLIEKNSKKQLEQIAVAFAMIHHQQMLKKNK